MTATTARFSCSNCGKQYPWKAQYAGKPVKCACGAVFKAPASPPNAAAVSQERPAARKRDDGLRCPSCGSAMKPGDILCINCGFNIQTGRKITDAPEVDAAEEMPSAPAAPPRQNKIASPFAIPGIRPVKTNTEEDQLKKTLVIGGAIVVLVGILIGAGYAFKLLQKEDKPALGDDAEVAATAKEFGAHEALQWLKESPHHGVFGSSWTREKAIKKVEQWYEMGAKKVLAFGGVLTRYFAIELPDDKPGRERFLKYQRQLHDQTDDDEKGVKDVGQKYMIMYPY